jgi:AcrR family transcriptional regulator
MPSTDPTAHGAPLGLRERKKMQTRAAIQRHALRLFRETGYAATTMEQIAAAADVSPSTLYRYFPAKEDLILADDYDPLLIADYHRQPPEVGPLQALRASMNDILGAVTAEERAEFQERIRLTYSIPEVRAKAMDQMTQSLDLLAELIAARTGRPADDFAVHVLAGSVIGALLAAQQRWMAEPDRELLEVLDAAFEHVIAGPAALGNSPAQNFDGPEAAG